ncbi:tRNA adenosine(34) deaminase TadA [Gilvimarinus agarilyticus]|uniref:tRNA adenosine(34) deaminase TadA n=1 Tax=Gilvimarinus agarilyticus TaxID=679259 RepID=UPI000A047590
MQISPGLYRHYKGGEYFVYRIATHSETREPLVVYRCLYGDFSWWVRPLAMFTETVERDGQTLLRFAFVAPMSLVEAERLAHATDSCIAHRPEDLRWMQEAQALAEQAADNDEVPVGAVVVRDGLIVGRGYNRPIGGCDPTAHAEMMALREAARQLGNYRLNDCTLYVTLEPCTMCVGAMVHARVGRLVYGTTEPKAGVVESQAQLLDAPYFNHSVQVTGGVAREACQQQLSAFFKRRRHEQKQQRQLRGDADV